MRGRLKAWPAGRAEGELDASIYIRGKLHALLKPGKMPGWRVLAKKTALALQLDLSGIATRTAS